jgi:microcystin-dependent protein
MTIFYHEYGFIYFTVSNSTGITMLDGTIGEIRLFAGSFEPEDWIYCDGRTLKAQQEPALYSVLAIRYGGDLSKQEFQLPNLAPLKEADGGPTPVRYLICKQGAYPIKP